MMVYNHSSKKWDRHYYDLTRGIVYISSTYIEFGYFEKDYKSIPFYYNGNVYYIINEDAVKTFLYYNNKVGCYVFSLNQASMIITESKYNFWYPIERCYNFSKLSIPKSKIILELDEDFKAISQFTFGLEYETSGGNIPWLDCLKNNLIPLYDGSISGHEYVTFPLNSNELSIIKNHFELLKKYTDFDKNCSLHIHFGGFPITHQMIDRLVKFWYVFQHKLQPYIPVWSYYVEEYKTNGKSYNKPLNIRNLQQFYEKYTGNMYTNEACFYLKNIFDADEERKWEVHGRYHNLNIMHLISGEGHKTVEFRFLRPTTNYSEIKWYILVFGAFLNYVINSTEKSYKNINVDEVIKFTYNNNLASKLIIEGKKLMHLYKNTHNIQDYGGLDDKFKQKYLSRNNFNI